MPTGAPGGWSGRPGTGGERGTALLLVVMIVVLLSAVGLAMSVAARTETLIAANFRQGRESLYAAEAAIALAVHALTANADWNGVLAGGAPAAYADGPAPGMRDTPGGDRIALCCGPGTLTAEVQERALGGRDWGPDSPRWQLFAWGPATGWLTSGRIESVMYVGVWVGDDPRDGDGNPALDSNGVLELHAQSRGPGGGRRMVEATVARADAGEARSGGPGVRIVSWREVTW